MRRDRARVHIRAKRKRESSCEMSESGNTTFHACVMTAQAFGKSSDGISGSRLYGN